MVPAILQEYHVDMNSTTFEYVAFFTNVSMSEPIINLDVQRDSRIISLCGKRVAVVKTRQMRFPN